MSKKITLKTLITSVFVACMLTSVSAQQKLDLSQKLPIDSKVVKGKLANGLTYYIRPNAKPEKKVELRLVVNAGSILEKDSQQGLAHFMEHMNFNGLKHFPKNELVGYLQKIGVQFGADLNANTGWDRTLYILPIPTDQSGNLENGFQIIADWSHNALLSTDEINAERNVISEELRMRDKNAGTRMMEKFLPALLNGSRYAYRLPGGKDSIVQHADPERVREFYKDWYRPNLEAVVVVGDITVEKAKEMIQKYFGDFKNPTNERTRTYYDIKPYTKADAKIVTDDEATGYSFSLFFPSQVRKPVKTIGDYRNMLVRNIFTQTLNKKLRELAQQGKPPYTSANAFISGAFGGITLHNEGFEMDVTPIDNFKTSIDSAVAELLRIKDYGFTKSDIETIKKEVLSSYEKSYNERDKTKSSSYVREYVGNFMRQETIPGIENEYNYAKNLLPTITVEEVSKLANEVLSNSKNFFALITAPTKGNIKLPSKSELLSMVKASFQQTVKAPKKDTQTASSLLATAPKAGKIVSEKSDKDLGTTTYTLSNGILVTVKPTTFKSDEILLSGVKYSGIDQFGVDDLINARNTSAVVSAMGYGQFSPTDLGNFLAGKTVKLSTDLGQNSSSVSGNSSVKDFETLLQLNYLKLTSPRLDTGLFTGYITKMKTRLKFMKANPQIAYIDTLMKVMYNNSPLAPNRFPDPSTLDKVNPEACIAIYKKQFTNANGLHFFIVGNTKDVDLKPLIEKYIASLPVSGKAPKYKDNGLRAVQGKKVFKFKKGNNQKSLILSLYHGTLKNYSDNLALKADLLGQIMTMEIIDTVREKMAVIYSGGANASLEDVPYVHYSIMSYLPCGPENVDKILKELDKEVADFKATGGPKGYLAKAKKTTLEQHNDNMKKNSYWASKLEQILFWGQSKNFFLNFDKELDAISNDDMISTAKLMLTNNHFTAVSLPVKITEKKD